ncbi:MAG TPA: ATP-binding cassette domain-containing protein [Rubrivivax sp.]|nr:ATP-binding cassette domain-containing protein [Rubrivivax sp.]
MHRGAEPVDASSRDDKTIAVADDPLLKVEGLALGFPDKPVLHDLNFEVQRGEVFAILGGSGGGKSTLLRCLIGLHRPTRGRVLYGQRDLYRSDDATLAQLRREFGVMFQAGALWSSMTVGENVMLPLQMVKAGNTLASEAEREREARFKLALVGLGDAFDAEPAALSGGMRKRAAIARALALNPPLLFLDEPSAGLDPLTSARLDELIVHLCKDLGTTVVMVSHDLDSVFTVADRAVFLDAQTQTVAAIGPPLTLRETGPDVVRDFLSRGQGGGA